uniref:Uncharacterized protein n=1 Tax=Arundo donax TaxID=35708 RepID=A0A0A9HPL4_ARUDO
MNPLKRGFDFSLRSIIVFSELRGV